MLPLLLLANLACLFFPYYARQSSARWCRYFCFVVVGFFCVLLWLVACVRRRRCFVYHSYGSIHWLYTGCWKILVQCFEIRLETYDCNVHSGYCRIRAYKTPRISTSVDVGVRDFVFVRQIMMSLLLSNKQRNNIKQTRTEANKYT